MGERMTKELTGKATVYGAQEPAPTCRANPPL
ncbi:hypothetical protein WRSd5_p00271 (plasmid) [Shigella dysenteriae WRSd5]|nr:hypothetical protein WRSd5_p00122 [Shigella dysenteriae WRSd5]ESU76746.1 hypothetical protein WRSd5_p00193 [Shigella dysenteriae WRSd5]ESU76824.1 hypothetical protein WRSd5_p00271 [Shigella dysenteriae WRSd5]